MCEHEEEDIIYGDVTVDGTRHIKAATLSRLVDELIQKAVTPTFIEFRDTFLLTFREYTTPHVLLDLLITRYDAFQMEAKDAHTQRREGVIGALMVWIERFYIDFEEESIRHKLEEFLVKMELTMASIAKQLRATFEKAQARLEEESLPVYVHAAAPAPMPAGGWTLLSERVLAEQMTLLDSKMYLAVQPKECFGLAWTKRDKEINAPNICAILGHFEMVNRWVTSSIVTQILRSQRVEMLKKFIRLMELLRELNNLNGMFAIYSGIQSIAVSRMKLTFAELGEYTARLQDMEELLSSNYTYYGYRTHMKSTVPPCVPYIGVYLSDLTYAVEGNRERYGHCINISFYHLQAEIISNMQVFQVRYNLEISPDILHFFTTLTTMTEEECYWWSLKVEPRVRQLV